MPLVAETGPNTSPASITGQVTTSTGCGASIQQVSESNLAPC